MIVACDNEWNIGKNGKLPWRHMKEDMEIFKKMTTEGDNPCVLMGRKTWDSIPSIHRPLPNRLNIVLSNSVTDLDGALVTRGVTDALKMAVENNVDKLWVIGGESIYYNFMGIATDIYITSIDNVFEGCDVKFPYKDLLEHYKLTTENHYITENYKFKFQNWKWKK